MWQHIEMNFPAYMRFCFSDRSLIIHAGSSIITYKTDGGFETRSIYPYGDALPAGFGSSEVVGIGFAKEDILIGKEGSMDVYFER